MSRNCGVSGHGPSSKVSAITRWFARSVGHVRSAAGRAADHPRRVQTGQAPAWPGTPWCNRAGWAPSAGTPAQPACSAPASGAASSEIPMLSGRKLARSDSWRRTGSRPPRSRDPGRARARSRACRRAAVRRPSREGSTHSTPETESSAARSISRHSDRRACLSPLARERMVELRPATRAAARPESATPHVTCSGARATLVAYPLPVATTRTRRRRRRPELAGSLTLRA